MIVQTQEGTDQRIIDSSCALQKVIRLDKKHTNFDYHDPYRRNTLRINYPQTQPEGPSSDILLKSLWKHVSNYYFKKIQDPQIQRLDYIESTFFTHPPGQLRFYQSKQFWSTMESIFSIEQMQGLIQGEDQISRSNWLQAMNLVWNITKQSDVRQQKRLFIEFSQFKKQFKYIYAKKMSMKRKGATQNEKLKEYLDENQEYDQILTEIHEYQKELQNIREQAMPIFKNLKQKVYSELRSKDIIYCVSEQQQQTLSMNHMEIKLNKYQNHAIQISWIKTLIRQLQQKQIAQSISKLNRIQKDRGRVYYQIVFQKAMAIPPQRITQQEFEQLNKLRQYSLLKFYNTASKSKYSFICQNFLGFKQIYNNRLQPSKLKDKNIMAEIKQAPIDPLTSSYCKEFNKMEICHHCKLLHPQSALVKCQYTSSKWGNPIPQSPFYDSYLHQVLKNQQSRTTAIRSINSCEKRKNSYFQYQKVDDQYICGRSYCKYCLKNYQEGRQKAGGLCPYCRGICYCTRCSRNQTMIRLKSMHLLLGGDMNELQSQSKFQKYFKQKEQEKQPKTLRKNNSAPPKMNQKIHSIRYQLEDLRLLCDLVKRREKNKIKLFNVQKGIFRTKISLKDQELFDSMSRRLLLQENNEIQQQLDQSLQSQSSSQSPDWNGRPNKKIK